MLEGGEKSCWQKGKGNECGRFTYRSRCGSVELLCSGVLSLGAEVLDLGLAKDDVGGGRGRLEHVRLADDEEDLQAQVAAVKVRGGQPGETQTHTHTWAKAWTYVLALLDGHTHDAWDWLHA